MKFFHKSAEAARLLAEDRMTRREICDRVGISPRTLYNWQQEEDFNRRVNSLVNERMRRAFTTGLARKEKRLEDLNALYEDVHTVKAKRAADQTLARIPGGETGLITLTYKAVGRGHGFRLIPVYELDRGMIDSILDIQARVADELGQRVQRHELMGPDAQPLNFSPPTAIDNNIFALLDLDRLSNDQLRQLSAIFESYLSGDSVVQPVIEAGRAGSPEDSDAVGQDQERTGQA
jgi:AcrR family transcriptional regulator